MNRLPSDSGVKLTHPAQAKEDRSQFGWKISHEQNKLELKQNNTIIKKISCEVLKSDSEKPNFAERIGLASRIRIGTQDQQTTVRVWNASFGSWFGFERMKEKIQETVSKQTEFMEKNSAFFTSLEERLKEKGFSDERSKQIITRLSSSAFQSALSSVQNDGDKRIFQAGNVTNHVVRNDTQVFIERKGSENIATISYYARYLYPKSESVMKTRQGMQKIEFTFDQNGNLSLPNDTYDNKPGGYWIVEDEGLSVISLPPLKDYTIIT